MITAEELRAIVNCDPSTGTMTWRVNKGKYRAGDPVGGPRRDGYIRTKINQKGYLVHRLIWLWATGYLPDELDHINHNPSDNRIENLRECSRSQNQANKSRKKSKPLPKGVRESGKNTFYARLVVDGKEVGLGTFQTASAASDAYLKASKKHYGEFAYGD